MNALNNQQPNNQQVVSQLLHSQEPNIRYKIWTDVLGQDADSELGQRMKVDIERSARVGTLLSERDKDGELPFHPYTKWYGAHWVLAMLADMGYPAGNEELIPLRDQVYGWLLGKEHQRSIKTIRGRVRRCASQEGNALYALLALGIADTRTDELAKRLVGWQWPDGGWNCDKRPEAVNSSFMESLIPLRGLAIYAQLTGNRKAKAAVEAAADIFLKRHLYKRQRDGIVMHEEFTRLHYPAYWHYDILFGLKVMSEAGFIHDERCQDALDLLAEKRLPDGGFPAEGKYYRVTDKHVSGRSPVDWGGTSKRHMNEFVTVDALTVLGMAGRLNQKQVNQKRVNQKQPAKDNHYGQPKSKVRTTTGANGRASTEAARHRRRSTVDRHEHRSARSVRTG